MVWLEAPARQLCTQLMPNNHDNDAMDAALRGLRSLSFEDITCDGVFDCWGKFPETAGQGGAFPTLAALQAVPAKDGDDREVRCTALP